MTGPYRTPWRPVVVAASWLRERVGEILAIAFAAAMMGSVCALITVTVTRDGRREECAVACGRQAATCQREAAEACVCSSSTGRIFVVETP